MDSERLFSTQSWLDDEVNGALAWLPTRKLDAPTSVPSFDARASADGPTSGSRFDARFRASSDGLDNSWM